MEAFTKRGQSSLGVTRRGAAAATREAEGELQSFVLCPQAS